VGRWWWLRVSVIELCGRVAGMGVSVRNDRPRGLTCSLAASPVHMQHTAHLQQYMHWAVQALGVFTKLAGEGGCILAALAVGHMHISKEQLSSSAVQAGRVGLCVCVCVCVSGGQVIVRKGSHIQEHVIGSVHMRI
jgi:hypothetical protein